MEKDIDDLLDEVESQFVKKEKCNKTVPKTNIQQSSTHKKAQSSTQKKRSQMDDAINDILDLDLNDHDGHQKSQGMTKSSSASASGYAGSSEATKKCFPIFLGGSTEESGRSTTVNNRTCDQLRCTACDFRVSFFDDFSWQEDTSYLFLRNNVPDFQKLKSKLSQKKGCRAYCCQCSWRNVSTMNELNDPNLKWVCGKHAS